MKRKLIQWTTMLLTNSYLTGFLQGKIYKGPLKSVCVPGLNCYSCPGAAGACPIGSLQAVIGSMKYNFSFYVTGILMSFGLLFGRFVCGFLCPFGLIQELFYKIPSPKIKNPWRRPQAIKYVILAVFVIGMPLIFINSAGLSSPAFCAYICPSGTLTAAIPLLLANAPLRQVISSLFYLKLTIAALVIIGSLFIYRFFCRYLCPLGAIYALFNRISLYQLRLDVVKCNKCGACRSVCKMGVDPSENLQSMDCIRCGDCVSVCPTNALSAGFGKNTSKRHFPACDACKRGVKK
jgi:ferredoxin-type protein NapH